MSTAVSQRVRKLLIVTVAVAVAIPVAAFLGRASPGSLVLVELRGTDPAALEALGAEVVVDYGNGFALVRTDPLAPYAPAGTKFVPFPMGSRTRLDIAFSGWAFDTADKEPVVPEELRGTGGVYLVQLIGPVRSEWVQELTALGVEFSEYFANYAFAVRAPATLVETLREQPFVEWVGEYHPAYRISREFGEETGQVRAAAVGFPSVSTSELEAAVTQVGGEILQSWNEPSTVEFLADRLVLDDLAKSPLVLRIEKMREMHVMDARAGAIHKYHSAWYMERTSLPYTLTGKGPGNDGVQDTADDDFEGIGIQDTGFDEGSASDGTLDFFDGPTGDRVLRFQDRTGASVPDGKCGSAHGTHVIGIVAGDGYAWEKYLIEDKGRTDVSLTDHKWDQGEAGVAPEAKVSVDGIQGGNAVFCGSGVQPNPTYWDSQYNDGYPTVNCRLSPPNTAGCVFVTTYSNSYGSGPGSYGATAIAVDSRMDTVNEKMVVFAAGNDGPNPDTVQAESLAKNGLSVAASQNYRPDQFESDNPNLLAGFSGRGGPGQNGRIKPDVAAIGTSVISLFARGEYNFASGTPANDWITEVDKYDAQPPGPGSDGIADYRYLQGTSMATPHAAGLFALTREYLREIRGGNSITSPFFNPPAYAAKALMINGAVRMDENLYAYPGPDQGWGRIDLEQSLFPPVPRSNQITIGQFPSTGNCNIGTGSCSGGSITTGTLITDVYEDNVPLKVTLVWHDTSGSALARNLDLQVVSPSGDEYHGTMYTSGWSTLNPAGYDSANTVEQVEVETPEPGTWTVNVIGTSIPSTARFAVVFSANIGPQTPYKVDLSTTSPTALSVAPGGSSVFPFRVYNFGTNQDDIQLSAPGAPGVLTVSFSPSATLNNIDSGTSQEGFAILAASGAATSGVYTFDIIAASQRDPSSPAASDFLTLTVEILDAPLPEAIRITTEGVDELDPSVLVFRDGTVGGHIFIAYRKSTAVQPAPNDYLGGVNVWVAHAALDTNGFVSGAWDYKPVSGLNDQPNDLRLLRVPAGSWSCSCANRVIVTWTGEDPNASDPDTDSWGRVAWIDPGAGPTYYNGGWTATTIEANYGGRALNVARVSFPLWRSAGGQGELYWVWEHLDYAASGQDNPNEVRTNMIRSSTGGSSWPSCGAWSATNTNCILISPNDSNFYFFPNGVVDQNDIAWLFFYWRTSGGNDRDLNVRLYDGAAGTATPYSSMSSTVNLYDTTDNVQWPAAVSTTEGVAGNRVYFVVTRDQCGSDLKLFSAYTDGDYTSSTPPSGTATMSGTCNEDNYNLSPDFTLINPFVLLVPVGLGTSVSNANYNRRPILNIVETDDAGTKTIWLPVMETATPYNEQNLWSWYSDPAGGQDFSNAMVSKITANAFAKGHQMSSTLTSGTTGRVYETWHENKGTSTSVNYDVYLTIYSKNWETAPDTVGPIVTNLATVPGTVNLTDSPNFQVLANANDVSTGNSDIAAVEYQIDGGSWSPMVPVDTFDSPAEAAQASDTAGALAVGTHQLCARAQDAASNWGSSTCIDFEVTGTSPGDVIPPIPPVVTAAQLASGNTANVEITWDRSTDEGSAGGTIEYQVWRATGSIGGPFVQIGVVLGTMAPTYTYTCVGCGHGDTNLYFFQIRSVDNASNSATAAQLAAKYTKAISAGSNLLSIPLVLGDYSVGTVLQTFPWDTVRTYRSTDANDPWKAAYAGRPGDLTAFQFGDGVWVSAPSSGRYTIAGLVQNTPTFNLGTGWHLVAYAAWVSETRDVSLAAVAGVARVETFDSAGAAAPYQLRAVSGSELLVGGEAYWVWVTGAGGNWQQG